MIDEVFSGSYIQVRVEDGVERAYLRHSVHVFLVTDEGNIRITTEKKLGSHEVKEKIQGGILDEGEEPLVCAKRELLEELGYIATDWQLFEEQKLTGTVNDTRHYFIARGLEQVTTNIDGEVLETADYTLAELYEKAMTSTFSPLTKAVIARLHFEVNKGNIIL